MALSIADIASKIGGVVEGDAAREISGVAALGEAGPGDLSFLANPRYAAEMAGTKAAAVIVSQDWQGDCAGAVIRVGNPDQAFAEAVTMILPACPEPESGVHPTAVIDETATLGEAVSIGPYCVVEAGARLGNRVILGAGSYIGHAVTVGDDCRFHTHVSIRERVIVGARAIIHNGAVIGSDGFGYTRQKDCSWKKIPQLGIVEIGDDVEIGANVTIDRARFGKTLIGNGVKIDNLVQIAHNVVIGDNTAIAAQTGIAGSASVGCNVQLAGQVGIVGHIHIGDHVVAGARSCIFKDVPPQSFVFGYPAMDHMKLKKVHAHTMRLPELKKRVADLEKKIEEQAG